MGNRGQGQGMMMRLANRLWGSSRPRLQTQLVLAAFVPTVLVLAAMGLLGLVTYSRVIESLALERSEALTRLAAQQIGLDLAPFVNTLTTLSNAPDIASGIPERQALALRLAMPELQLFDGGVVIVDSQGQVMAADPRRADLPGQDWSDRDFVAIFMSGQATLLGSSIHPIGPDGGPAVAISIVTGAGAQGPQMIAGLFRLDVPSHSSAFYRLLLRHRNWTDRRVYMVDRESARVASSEGMAPLSPEAIARIQSSDSDIGALRMRLDEGQPYVVSYATVPATAWLFVETEHWSVATRTSQRYGRALMLLIGVGLALPTLLVGLGAQRVVRPLEELTTAAQAMSEGDLSQRITPPRELELFQLATSYNQMSAELESLYYGLERQVADRTRELTTLNKLATQLTSSLDVQQTLRIGLEHLASTVGWPEGLAYRSLHEQDRLRVAGLYQVDAATPEELSMDDSLIDAVWIGKAQEAPEQIARLAKGISWRTVVTLPLSAREHFQGIILLGSHREKVVTQEQRALLDAMGRQIALAADNARLYELAETEAVIAERNRLARELHDSVTQTLFSANLLAGVIPLLRETNPQEAERRQGELRELTQGALAEMRTLLLELRPSALMETPLDDLLRQLVAAVSGRSRLPIALEVDELPDLPAEVRLAFYRAAQEALNNVVKHAQASHASIRLTADTAVPSVCMTVQDDGRGFDADAVEGIHFGLQILQERADSIAGTLRVQSAPGEGTTVALQWPSAECDQLDTESITPEEGTV